MGRNLIRAHDLVRIDPAVARAWRAPAWVARSLARAPWAVVRRAIPPGRAIAIGIRGSTRSERFAAFVRPDDVREHLAPYALVARIGASCRSLDAVARAIDAAARSRGIAWGPTGAYGFELASDVVVTHAASDLDGIVREATRATLGEFATACARIAQSTGVRVDLEVQVRYDGVALDEYVGPADRVLAKTSRGPALVAR